MLITSRVKGLTYIAHILIGVLFNLFHKYFSALR